MWRLPDGWMPLRIRFFPISDEQVSTAGRTAAMCYNARQMYVVLLRLALACYTVGLAHSVLTVLKKKQTLFKLALYSVLAGFVFQVASIVVRAAEVHYLPLTQRYQALSFFCS